MLTAMQQDLATSRQEKAILAGQVRQIQGQLTVQAHTVPRSAATTPLPPSAPNPTSISVTVPPVVPLAPPEGFSGDPAQVQTFLTQLHFLVRLTCCPDPQSRIAFFISYLSMDAAIWVIPQVSSDDP
mgnify:CR=1 FL=1